MYICTYMLYIYTCYIYAIYTLYICYMYIYISSSSAKFSE